MRSQVAATECGKVCSLSDGRKGCVVSGAVEVRVARRQVVMEEPRRHYGSCFRIAAKRNKRRENKFAVPAHFATNYKVPIV